MVLLALSPRLAASAFWEAENPTKPERTDPNSNHAAAAPVHAPRHLRGIRVAVMVRRWIERTIQQHPSNPADDEKPAEHK